MWKVAVTRAAVLVGIFFFSKLYAVQAQAFPKKLDQF